MGLLNRIAPAPRGSALRIRPVPAAPRDARLAPLAQGVAVALMVGLAGNALPRLALADQIAPNPNAGPIDVTASDSNDESFQNGGTIAIAPAGTLTNNGTLYNGSGATIDNAGTLTNASYLVNEYGTIGNAGTLTNNGYLGNYGGTIGNAGTLTNNGYLGNYGGTIESSGTLTNNGALANEYGTITNLTGGTLTNNAGIASFGAISNAAGASLINAAGATLTNNNYLVNDGTLDNAGILTNNYWMGNAVRAVIDNTGVLANNDAFVNLGTLNNRVGGTVNERGTYAFDNGGIIDNRGLFDIESTGGYGLSQLTGASFVNGGILTIAADGRFGNYDDAQTGTRFIQEGGSLQTDGTLFANSVLIEGGILSGNGEVGADLIQIGADATVAPGSSPGILRFAADTELAGTLSIEIDGTGPGEYDVLDASGFAFALLTGATLDFDFGFDPTPGQHFAFLLADDLSGWQQARILVQAPGGAIDYVLRRTAEGLDLLVPLPGTLVLMPLGLAGLGLMGRRRRTLAPGR